MRSYCVVSLNNKEIHKFITVIPTKFLQRNFSLELSETFSQNSYMLSLTECVWEFRNNALWDTHHHAVIKMQTIPLFGGGILTMWYVGLPLNEEAETYIAPSLSKCGCEVTSWTANASLKSDYRISHIIIRPIIHIGLYKIICIL